MSPNARINDLLSRQDGLLSLAQAVGCGISRSTVQRRARSGEWERLLPRVFLVGGHPFTDAVRIRATWMWAGEHAAVSGPAAAGWHTMLAAAPARIDVTVPRRCCPQAPRGVRLRRRDLSPTDLVGLRGLWLTDGPLTALETAIAVPDGSVFLDRALQKHVSFERVYQAYCRSLGARGSARMNVLLTAAADRANSAAERLMIGLLRTAGITGWVHNHPFGPYKIDFAFPAIRLAIEVDGWAWHMDVERFRADRHKQNAIVRDGWDPLRFTWHDLKNRPDYVIAEVRAALIRLGITA
ncbi:type IV toxin-antitoxin system AbiEi family antitoxin domain-containing protein [Pseudonocardia sp. H11422]|uniref:type IV toxin-antitoxin system AbiEi family antitoxin domain-containing protein n=1 Tax=Pseudonocardia sp. H11422 TaxID=2835866 RepID=UPI001BDC42B9|nr:type IV toxin-antitoxin system AbiEi family antitoxin domain-containing protein [Pseudonocardia sp. H11422]